LDGTPEDSIRQALLGHAPLSVLGAPQGVKTGLRRYVPPVYRAIPQRLRPVAAKVFHFLLDRLGRDQSELEVKHEGANFEK
jgi:hypothetical protein